MDAQPPGDLSGSPAVAVGPPPADDPSAPQVSEGTGGASARLRRRLLLGLAAVGLIYLAYVFSLQFFAYTSDAFVANDVVMVAPEVEGRIVAVHVKDNENVRAGAPIIDLDPVPYQLKVSVRSAELAKTEADEQAAVRQIAHIEAQRGRRWRRWALPAAPRIATRRWSARVPSRNWPLTR